MSGDEAIGLARYIFPCRTIAISRQKPIMPASQVARHAYH